MGKDFLFAHLFLFAFGSLFICGPRCAWPIAKKLAYSKKLLYKYHCASRELLCVCWEASSEFVLHSLNQHFLTVYNVDARFGDRLDSAACDVIDCVLNIAGCNILNACRDCRFLQNPSCSFV